MKIGSDIIKVYKDVHIWTGILSGLMLFIAFYAGAISMFETPLQRWATPPSTLPAAPPLERAKDLLDAVVAAHPQAARDYSVLVRTTPEQPARVIWHMRGTHHGESTDYAASLDAAGRVQVQRLTAAPVAGLVDQLHQSVGLAFAETLARYLMGTVALLYAVALISGLIVLLPTLTRDLFCLRIGPNLKRMWLDVHNALGLVSLPFHLVMALTSVAFAFHDPFYRAQEQLLYAGPLHWGTHTAAPAPAAPALAPQELLRRVQAQLPQLEVERFDFTRRGGTLQATFSARDIRHGSRARDIVRTGVNPYTGQVDPHDLPGHMDGWSEAVNTFFMLHFGSFGGAPMRWIYFLLGMAGAGVFYTGNLLWLESRRRKQRNGAAVTQSRSTRILGALSVGVALGCVAGISATLAATKWLPALTDHLAAWHAGIYYAVFVAAIAWALWRGAACGAHTLLLASATLTALIPLGSVAGLCGIAGTWNHPGSGVAIDLTAAAAVPVLLLLARHTRRRSLTGARDSLWSAAAAQA
jgi:uncharacterized iron-regulated membrane protein